MQSQKIAIAATFTAEPVAELLAFWLKKLNLPAEIAFAPYNQPFQQLLDPSSLLSTNGQGANVILLRLEDWLGERNRLGGLVDAADLEQRLAGKSRYRLPNRLEIAQLNEYETEYLYGEIFRDQVYLKHGIELRDGDCVLDIGANIGMFTLFVLERCKDARVYSFEPSPYAFAALETNAALYGQKAKAYCCGVSDADRQAEFTFYRHSSVFSSFYANAEDDKAAIREVVKNVLASSGSTGGQNLDSFADELMEERLKSETFTCPLRSLSSIIRENQIERIDLLKLDAEKSELDVLRGIEEQDWPKIRQMVAEVHDKEGWRIAEVKRLLEEKGFEFSIEEEDLLRESGVYNVYATRRDAVRSVEAVAQKTTVSQNLRQSLQDFSHALQSSRQRSHTPVMIFSCPPSPQAIRDPEQKALLEQMEAWLAAQVADLNGVQMLGARQLLDLYPVAEYYDPHSDELGHIPYTPSFFTALATVITRKYFGLRQAPYKVVVTDCDEVLWKGICGESGPLGVEMDEDRLRYQQFLVEQHAAGVLICLCSKNNEADVLEVFERRPEMRLRREHLVGWRINWKPKSENLRSLAEELNLGLDSLIFLDDSPMECAEVRANCPEVLTLQLPSSFEHIGQFVRHLWPTDSRQITAEDHKRTELYRQNVQREKVRQNTLTLADFLGSLELSIEIEQPRPEDLTRVAQLTQRTSQFNCTTLRRSEAEIGESKLECLAVRVRDRFGDYGLVGVTLFRTLGDALDVDTFLLSCRVLGRGVEHRVLRSLSELAVARGLKAVNVRFVPTAKNLPAREFLEAVGQAYCQALDGGFVFRFPAGWVPEINEARVLRVAAKATGLAVSEKPGARAPSELLQEIATELCDAESILRAVKAQKTRSAQRIVTAQDKPQTPVEETVAEVWGEVLRMEEIPIHDHFFNQLGGDSLLGTQIISRLRQLFGLHLPLRALFEAPTVASLSMVILQDMAQDGQRSEVTGILAELEGSDQPVPEGGDKILL